MPALIITYTALITLIAGWYIRKYKRKKRKLDLTINRINEAVISLDTKGRYTFLNDSALATHVLGREKTLGRVIWDMHPETVGTDFWHLCNQATASGLPAEAENYYAAIDKWFSVKIYPSDTGLTIFYQDITESKKIGIAFAKSEEKYRTLFYKSPLPSWLYDLETLCFVDVNEAAVKHYGYTRDEFLSMSIKDIRPREDIPALLEDIAQVKSDTDTSRYSSWRHKKKNGEILVVETTAHSFSQDGKHLRIVTVNDITQKMIMEQKLLDNQAKLTEAQAMGRIGYWDIDLKANIHIWSDELYKILGFDMTEVMPSTAQFLSLLHPEDKKRAEVIIHNTLNHSVESKIDFRFITAAGENRFGSMEWRFAYNENKVPIRLFGILQDITERKKAEESSRLLALKIKEQKIQAQRKISKAIIKAQEQHKNYVAQELHDNINQILFGARFHLGIAGRKCEETKELVKDSIDLVNKAMKEIHLLCENLVTPLKDIDLYEIVNELIHKSAASTDIPLHMDFCYEIPCEFSDDLKLNIYRIVQEQLHNIRKHAQAKNVKISLALKENSICIIVEDDGKGFDVKQKRKGLGISNITHRVEAFNGSITIQSNPGAGCKTEVMIPLKVDNKAQLYARASGDNG
ncbi:PAS domain S-box protein [Flavobacterium album]|nr:PAS domain-containing sensor histidine kinase [Flavobacterium album]